MSTRIILYGLTNKSGGIGYGTLRAPGLSSLNSSIWPKPASEKNACLTNKAYFTRSNYKPYKRMHLRNILFNNERLSEIALRAPDSETAWTQVVRLDVGQCQGSASRFFVS